MGEVFAIHEHPEYMQECCELLNSEWPKNNDMRLEVMRSSRDELPCSFVLIGTVDDRPDRVLGHLQLALVQESEDACCIRSVLIRKERRRTGLGRLLMVAAEEHAKRVGFSMCYLSTIDQQEFYRRLGYTDCEPVYFLAAGRSTRNTQMVRKKLQSLNIRPTDAPTETEAVPAKKAGWKKCPAASSSPLPPPPPPPPLPPSAWRPLRNAKQDPTTYMKKAL